MKILYIFLSILTLTFTQSYAKQKHIVPVVIEAKKLIFDKKQHLARYIGDVTIKRGDITIKAYELNIYLSKDNKIERIIALGNVRFKKGRDIKGFSKKAILEKDKLILEKNAKIQQKNNIIEGDIIIYNIKTGTVEVKGENERVRTIIFPEE